MQIAKYLVAAGLTVLWASCAWAGIYTAPLDGLRGVYSSNDGDLGPDRRTAVFDFRATFDQIAAVRVHLTGTIAPGLFRNDRDPERVVDSQITPFINLSMQGVGLPEHPFGNMALQGAFDVERDITRIFFDPVTNTWNLNDSYLKTGRGEFGIFLGGFVPNESTREVVPALAGITGAYLVVEGLASTVPEPSVILWTMIGAMMFVSRRRGGR